MSKSGICNCGQTVTIPNSQCIFQCHKCNNMSLFLCHIIPDPKDFMNIRCKTCKSLFSMYTCPKCQATAVIKNFKSGQTYNCLCGFQATMITCNKCIAHLCLPNRKNYEQTAIKCKNCQNSFKYGLCPSCKQCIYLNQNQIMQDIKSCYNDDCPRNKQQQQKQQPKQPAKLQQLPIQNIQNNVELPKTQHQLNPYEMILNPKPVATQNQLCKMCYSNQICMINTQCFHLSVCEQCSNLLKGQCPICRAIGTYKKIYKT